MVVAVMVVVPAAPTTTAPATTTPATTAPAAPMTMARMTTTTPTTTASLKGTQVARLQRLVLRLILVIVIILIIGQIRLVGIDQGVLLVVEQLIHSRQGIVRFIKSNNSGSSSRGGGWLGHGG
mmetsp:Transcript_10029/g.28940  ORF Transcript_10029/g.28940 Transcript_10029/m.28940 type:complete len:123 (+) Transcript_10029:156-524(+)